jgi:hypothetical protein
MQQKPYQRKTWNVAMDTSVYRNLNNLTELHILLAKLNVIKYRQTSVELWVKTYNSKCTSRAAQDPIK